MWRRASFATFQIWEGAMGDPILKPNIDDMVHHLEHLFGEPTAQWLFTTAKDGACPSLANAIWI